MFPDFGEAKLSLCGMQRSLRAPVGFRPQSAMLASTDMQMAGRSNDESLVLQGAWWPRRQHLRCNRRRNHQQRTAKRRWQLDYLYREGTTDFGVAHDAMGAKHYSTSPVYLAAAKPA